MWQCKFCNYTSIKKRNVQAHEKRKHLTQTENLIHTMTNNQIHNNEIEVKDLPLLDIKKPAQEMKLKKKSIILDVKLK